MKDISIIILILLSAVCVGLLLKKEPDPIQSEEYSMIQSGAAVWRLSNSTGQVSICEIVPGEGTVCVIAREKGVSTGP